MAYNSTIKDKYDRCGECRTGEEVRVFGKPPLCHYHELIRIQKRQADKKAKRAAIEQGEGKQPLTTPERYQDKGQSKTQAAKAKKHASQYSAKEAKRVAVYNAYAPKWKEQHPECQARLTGCTGATQDVHHKKLRGPFLLDTTTWLAVCRNCHNAIHQMPKDEAVSRGLMMYVHRNNDAA